MNSGRAILCIDDSREFLDAAKVRLEADGHLVYLAENGQDGLAILRSKRIDLLLLDYYLPTGSAEDVLAVVRDPLLQVILLTAGATERPSREMLDRLHIQGYCDKSRGWEEISLWVEVGLRFATSVQMLDASRQGLRHLLRTAQAPHVPRPLEETLMGLLQQLSGAITIKNAFIAVAPPTPLFVKPSPVEEDTDSHFPTTSAAEEPELAIAAAVGRFESTGPLRQAITQAEYDHILAAPRNEGVEIEGGWAVLPLWIGGEWLGCMVIEGGPSVETESWDLLTFFATQAATAVHNRAMATLDPNTGVHSHNFWQQMMLRELRTAFRFRLPVSLAFIEVQGLSEVREEHGQGSTQQLLECVGRVLRNSIRSSDLAGRGNAENEFLVFLPHTPGSGVTTFADHLRHMIEDQVLWSKNGPWSPHVAIGLAHLDPHPFDPLKLPHPLPGGYFPGMESLLRARAAEMLPNARDFEGAGWALHQCSDWSDPISAQPAPHRSAFLS